MNGLSWQSLIPYLVPIIVVAVLWLRIRPGREVPITPERLWIIPLVATLGIGTALVMSPHHNYGPLQYVILILAVALGVTTGRWRAHTVTLRHDGQRVLMSTSSYAFVLLIALVIARQIARTEMETAHIAVAIDAPLVFALGMIITQRLTLWRRIRVLQPDAITT